MMWQFVLPYVIEKRVLVHPMTAASIN